MHRDEKQALRDALIAARKVHHGAHGGDAALALPAHMAALHLPAKSIIGAYLPIGSELDTVPLMAALAAAGHDLCLPVCLEKDAAVIFRRYQIGDALAADSMGIEAPLADAVSVRPTLVLLPLLGFDCAGMRLGRGGGYYDRTLAGLRADGPVTACGMAYAMQMVDKCPSAPHDQALDMVMTEQGVTRFERDR